ncbi:MAG: DUF3775 domain-containing protein [Rhodovibrionaceae bacterium]
MIEMDSDKVCYLVIKMREYEEEGLIRSEFDQDDEGSNLHLGDQGEDDGELEDEEGFVALEDQETSEDTAFDELLGYIQTLDEEEQVELIALTWLGRGDYEKDEWKAALTAANERHNARTAHYLLGMPLLADYLEEGLAAFDLSCTDFDESRM